MVRYEWFDAILDRFETEHEIQYDQNEVNSYWPFAKI